MKGNDICGVVRRTAGKNALKRLFAAIVIAAVLPGCFSFGGRKSRTDNVQSFLDTLSRNTREAFAECDEFKLDDCVRVALRNNLSVKASDIEARISRLDKKTAFGNFLPSVSIEAGYRSWDKQPEVLAGDDENGPIYRATQDKDITSTSIDVNMPIFLPSSWFLYSLRSRGAEIGELVADYTRQMIALQVTALYYQCLGIRESEKALASQVKAAGKLDEEVKAFRRQGMVLDWQVTQAETLLMSRKMELQNARREYTKANAELMSAMGLSPLEELPIASDTPLERPSGTIDELILEALMNNPELKIADRQIDIEREKAKIAIADFLPSLFGFASFTHTSNDYSKYASATVTGLSGVMTVFNGFANVNAYKSAREGEKEAYLRQEEACLTVMLNVINACEDLNTAEDQLQLATRGLTVARGRLAETESKWNLGMVEGSDRLQLVADENNASLSITLAKYREQASIAVLMNVIGKDRVGEYAE